MRTLWLYLHFPALQLDSIYSGDTSSQPIAIYHPAQSQIVQINKQASTVGIQLGMGLATASSLSSELMVVPYHAETEEKQLYYLANILYKVTSDICIYPPNGLLLRIHNMLELYGGLAPYWQTIRQAIQPALYQYSYATGVSPLSARLLARNQWNCVTDQTTQIKQALNNCHIDSTELEPKIKQKLGRVGIKTLGALLSVSLKDLAKRFDIELVTYLGRVNGELLHHSEFFRPPEHFSQYLELLYEIESTDKLMPPINRILADMSQFLKARDSVTDNIEIILHQRDSLPLTIRIASAQAEYKAHVWTSLVQLKLENTELTAPISGLTINTGKIVSAQPDKTDMFEGTQSSLSPLQLIGLLQAKLGEQALVSPCIADDARPEYASQYGAPLAEASVNATFNRQRPLMLLPQARPLTEKVEVVYGPERIHSGWWDGNPICRDYFIGRNHKGQWLWLYRTTQQHWFVHGLFS